MKIGLAHDWLNQMGGAENVLLQLSAIYPDAPVHTSIYGPELVDARFGELDIRTSFMQRLPGAVRRHRWYLPVYPLAFNSIRLDGYDVVISNASAFCKSVRTPPETLHVCYCLTPTRFVWSPDEYLAREDVPPVLRGAMRPMLALMRAWDRRTSRRVDRFVAISRAVADRIKNYYQRESEVIYPPVVTSAFTPVSAAEDYFLVVSRLAPYKRIDLAVRACTELGLPLKVIGAGRDRTALEALAGPSVEFFGRQDDDVVRRHFARCRALIFPGEEDFGITPVEAQAAGRPVIAFGAGGALDTVIPGETGEFFTEPTVDSLARLLKGFDDSRYAANRMIQNAQRFDETVFVREMKGFVETARATHLAGIARPKAPDAG
jgi:glycosyltransferase involved in cell wall biosynthesis